MSDGRVVWMSVQARQWTLPGAPARPPQIIKEERMFNSDRQATFAHAKSM